MVKQILSSVPITPLLFFFSFFLPLLLPIARNFEYEYILLTQFISSLLLPPCFLFLEKIDDINMRKQLALIMTVPVLIYIVIRLFFGVDLCLCSPQEFTFWFVINGLPSYTISIALMILLHELRKKFSLSHRKTLTLFFMIITSLGFDLLLQLWFVPQKRASHLILGFLHGPIYDYWIPVDTGLLLKRLGHFILGFGVIAFVFVKRSGLSRSVLILSIILNLVSQYSSKQYPSQGRGLQDLAQNFDQIVEEDLYILYASSITKKTYREAFAREVDFHLKDLKDLFSDQNSKFHIFLYPDKEQKKLWFGAEQTEVADVYTPSIHLNSYALPHPTLRHELIHAISSSYGFYGLGFHPNMAFTEGLAVALAPEFSAMTLDEKAYHSLKNGIIDHVKELFSFKFWRYSSQVAYSVAGSFLKFLIKEFGLSKVKELYSGKMFKDTMGVDLEPVLDDWKAYISKTTNQEKDSGELARYLFRERGLFDESCPHSRESLRREAKNHAYLSWRQPPNWQAGEHYLDWNIARNIYKKSHILQKIEKEALTSVKNSDRDHILLLIAKLENEFMRLKTIEDFEAKLLTSDLYLAVDDKQKSLILLDELKSYEERFQIPDYLSRSLLLRKSLLTEDQKQMADSWRYYLAGWGKIPETNWRKLAKLNNSLIYLYLWIRSSSFRLENEEDWYGLDSYWHDSGSQKLPKEIVEQWGWILGKKAYEIQNYKVALFFWQRLAEKSSEGKKSKYLKLIDLAQSLAGSTSRFQKKN